MNLTDPPGHLREEFRIRLRDRKHDRVSVVSDRLDGELPREQARDSMGRHLVDSEVIPARVRKLPLLGEQLRDDLVRRQPLTDNPLSEPLAGSLPFLGCVDHVLLGRDASGDQKGAERLTHTSLIGRPAAS